MKKINWLIFFLLFVISLAGCELALTEEPQPQPTPIPNTSGWTQMAINTSTDLIGICGNATNNIYTVSAEGYIWHYDGASWSLFYQIIPEPGNTITLNCIWVSPDNYVFVGGQEQQVGPAETGMVIWYDGTSWSKRKGLSDDVLKIWGLSSIDVYLTDKKGRIAYYDGVTDWTYMTQTVTTQPLYSIFGLDATTIYAGGGGTSNAIIRYSPGAPSTWTAMTINTSNPAVNNPVVKTIWGYSGAPNTWWCGGPNFTGLSNDGTSWTLTPVPFLTINGIWGTTTGSLIYGVGSYSSTGALPIQHNIFRYNNTTSSWDFQDGNPPTQNIQLNDIWGMNNEFFAVGEDGVILHYQ